MYFPWVSVFISFLLCLSSVFSYHCSVSCSAAHCQSADAPREVVGGGSLYITPHKQSDVHTFATSVLLIQGAFSRTVSTTFISHTVSSWTFCWVKKRLFLIHEEAPWLKCCISNEQRFKEKAEFHVVNRIERFALSAGYVFSTFYCNNASIFLLFLPRKTLDLHLFTGATRATVLILAASHVS